jgi:hypothetical protein
MKKILLAALLLVGSIVSASATCTGPAVMHDFPGTSFNMSLGTAADGNCASNVQDANLLAAVQAPLSGVTTAQTSAAASSLVAKASAGSIVSISGAAVSGSYIMVFNLTSPPADGAVTPLKCYGPMAAAGPFVIPWGTGPVLTASVGITIVSSSTGCFTKTATNANFLSVEYQ